MPVEAARAGLFAPQDRIGRCHPVEAGIARQVILEPEGSAEPFAGRRESWPAKVPCELREYAAPWPAVLDLASHQQACTIP